MPLDPSIILQAGRGVTPLESPMDAMGKALALKNQFQQTQMGGMQSQQLGQQIQDAQDLRQTLQSSTSLDDALAKAQKLGSPAAQGFIKSAIEMKGKGVTLSLDQNKLANEHLAKLGSGILSIANTAGATPEMVQDYVNREAQAGNLDPKGLQDTLSTLPKDAAGLKDWAKLQAVKLGTAEHILKLFTPQTKVDGSTAVTIDPASGKVLKAESVPGMPASELGKFAKDMGGTIDNPKIQAAWVRLHPNMATMMMGTGGTNALSPEAKQMLVNKYIQTGQLDSDLSARMPGLRNEVINAAAAQGKGNDGGTPDLAGAKQQFKTRQEAMAYFTKGNGANAFRQQETILHHADVFTGIADALNNGNIQAANKLGNAFGVQFGSDQATNYKIAGQILSAEVGKYLAGSQSTEAERRELAELIPSFSSPQQLKGGLATLKALVEGQRQSWTVQRDAALKGQVPTYSGDNGGASLPQPVPSAYKMGQVVKGYVFLGGDPTDQKNWKKQ